MELIFLSLPLFLSSCGLLLIPFLFLTGGKEEVEIFRTNELKSGNFIPIIFGSKEILERNTRDKLEWKRGPVSSTNSLQPNVDPIRG